MKRLFTLRGYLNEMRRKPSCLSSTGSFLFMMALAMMMLVPSGMKGATTTIDLETLGTVAYNAANGNTSYEINVQMGANYSGITNAKIGNKVDYRNNSSAWSTADISRVAFNYNNNGAGNADSDVDGFYFRRDASNGVKQSGLYNHKWNQEFAVLNLKPGDAVTFTYGGGAESGDNANLRIVREIDQNGSGGWLTQVGKGQTTSYTYNVGFLGDLVVRANAGTFLKKIEIVSNAAEYDITTSGNATTFKFTRSGSLEENDYAIPFLSASFGSINDYLVVQNLEAHMYNSEGNEDLKTQGVNFQPSAGSFYAFKPTSSGTISVKGSLQGEKIHVFVYNPALGTVGDWDDKVQDNFYSKTFTSGEFSFDVVKDKIYYICQDNNNESGNAFHLSEFTFTHSFKVEQLAKIVNLETDVVNGWIQLTKIEGAGQYNIHTKRCSGNITPLTPQEYKIEYNYLYMKAPTFAEGTDNGGTVIIDVKTQGGDVAFVATFPYHADFGYDETTGRSQGHIWNFIDPRNSDSNLGNCWIRNGEWDEYNKGTVSGILSIGQYKDTNSQFYHETQNREWTYSQRQTGSAGGFHDPYYANVFDMEGDNADMIWETEGLWFDTGTNLSCIYNEKNALAWNADPLEQKGNPVNFKTLQLVDDSGNPKTTTDNNGKTVEVNEDPDRYVGLLPDPNGKSSFTIPCLKDGDRVLIFMKSGEATGTNGIFLNVHGALDAEGTPISETDLYKAGGTNWIHSRYEGCYHFIKNGDGDMKFDMVGGSMCKIMYIRIYQGKRIDTNDIVSTKYIPIPGEFDANGKQKYTTDSGHLLFINDKGATEGDYSTLSEHYSGKGQNAGFQVLKYSGNLNASSFTGDNFKISGTYNNLLDFKSKVGEMGVFRLRVKDLTYTYTNNANQNKNYVADLCDRNFTVGYRDKVDYPYTWDFKDVKTYSGGKIINEADNYTETTDDYENTGWDISLFDETGYMKVNSGVDPSAENQIFSADKAGFGNQLWADDGVIAEMRGLWFYTDDNDPRYNDCLQITKDGLRLANTPTPGATDDPSDNTQRKAWWNYKMVVPSVPAGAAVYLRMKRDDTVPANATSHLNIDNADVYFLASRFNFGVASAAEKTNLPITADRKNQADYSCFKVPGTTDEWIVAIKNTTSKEDHLTFTLNGWILEKVAVSLDPKQIGKTGYATESRGRRIDHSLTSYLTGETIKAYTAHFATKEGSSDKDYSTAVLTRFDNTSKPNMSEATAKQNLGCILYHQEGVADGNNTNRTVGVLDGGFHLFVPDMHDNLGDNGRDVSVTDNVLLAFQPTVGAINFGDKSDEDNYLGPTDGSNSNLVLSAKKYKYGTDGSQVEEGYDVFFVRVDPDGNGGDGAFLNKCSAYLQIPTNKMKELVRSNNSKVNIVFDEDFLGNEGVATGVATFAQDEAASSQVYYTLSGVPVSKPTKGGMYIKNGKKVLVK